MFQAYNDSINIFLSAHLMSVNEMVQIRHAFHINLGCKNSYEMRVEPWTEVEVEEQE